MKILHRLQCRYRHSVAPPRGERGLKTPRELKPRIHVGSRSPSWGARIENTRRLSDCPCHPCRSPSWGARIENTYLSFITSHSSVAPPRGERGLKILGCFCKVWRFTVAPPRGERGLKSKHIKFILFISRRSPSWGARIEIHPFTGLNSFDHEVAPPRGERGLKSQCIKSTVKNLLVAPPRGERGLKYQ